MRSGFDPRQEEMGSDSRTETFSSYIAPVQDAKAPLPEIRCRYWEDGWTLSPPEPVDELNSEGRDIEAYMDLDGLTIYFASDRPGGAGGLDIYRASRANRDEPFQGVSNLTALNSDASEIKLVFAPDGLTAYLNTNRPGGPGKSDLWVATLPTPTSEVNGAIFSPDYTLSTPENDYDPFFSADGLRLYYVITAFGTSPGSHEIMVARRASLGDSFGPPEPVLGVNTEWLEDNPALTADERVIVFGSDRPGGLGGTDIWYATRPSASESFDEPRPLPVINSPEDDRETYISPDGCEIFFSSNRPGGKGNYDIYRTRFISASN